MTDPYVVIEGGVVQNDPEIPVFDLDVLDSDLPGLAVWDEIVDLRDRMKPYPALRRYVEACEEWMVEHGQNDPSLRHIPEAPQHKPEW